MMETSGCWMHNNVPSTPLTSSLICFLSLSSPPRALLLPSGWSTLSDVLPQWTLCCAKEIRFRRCGTFALIAHYSRVNPGSSFKAGNLFFFSERINIMNKFKGLFAKLALPALGAIRGVITIYIAKVIQDESMCGLYGRHHIQFQI